MRVSIIFYVYNEVRIIFSIILKVLLTISMILMLWWALSDRRAKVSMGNFMEQFKCRFFWAHFSKTYFGDNLLLILALLSSRSSLFSLFPLLSSLFFLLSSVRAVVVFGAFLGSFFLRLPYLRIQGRMQIFERKKTSKYRSYGHGTITIR